MYRSNVCTTCSLKKGVLDLECAHCAMRNSLRSPIDNGIHAFFKMFPYISHTQTKCEKDPEISMDYCESHITLL
jgi:hypothetical protein